MPDGGSYSIEDPATPVVGYQVDNPHAHGMLIAYLPTQKIAFNSDLYNPGFPCRLRRCRGQLRSMTQSSPPTSSGSSAWRAATELARCPTRRSRRPSGSDGARDGRAQPSPLEARLRRRENSGVLRPYTSPMRSRLLGGSTGELLYVRLLDFAAQHLYGDADEVGLGDDADKSALAIDHGKAADLGFPEQLPGLDE